MSNPLPVEKQVVVLTEIWARYRSVAKTSRRLKGEQGSWQRALLYGSVAAVVATPFASTLRAARMTRIADAVVVVGTVLFALMAWLNKQVLGEDSQQPWVRARQVSEGLKSLAFRFLAGLAPFDGNDGAQRALDQALDLVTKAEVVADGVSPAEAAEKIPKAPMAIADYLNGRLDDQVAFYERAADHEKSVVRRTGNVGLAISATLVICGAGVALTTEWRDIWAPALGAASVMITSQMALARRRFVVETYSTAAVKLRFARSRWAVSDHTPADEAGLVASVESILNGENAGWVEQMLLKPKAPAPAAQA
jgi:hypothetical protein